MADMNPNLLQMPDGTEQSLGLYAEQAEAIRKLLDEHAPNTTGNLQTRIAQVLGANGPDGAPNGNCSYWCPACYEAISKPKYRVAGRAWREELWDLIRAYGQRGTDAQRRADELAIDGHLDALGVLSTSGVDGTQEPDICYVLRHALSCIKASTEYKIGNPAFGYSEQLLTNTLKARTAGVDVPHTDHPLRHYDRTCPACNASL
jgi:hypothetical protein